MAIHPNDLWGSVSRNPKTNSWYVRGYWQGQRYYFSEYHTAIGPQTCKTRREGEMLQTVISSEILNKTFNPLRYKKKKPLHLKNYALTWLKQNKDIIGFQTWRGYRSRVNNHIITSSLADTFLPDISRQDYKLLWSQLKVRTKDKDGNITERPMEPKGKKNVLTCLFQIMDDAQEAGHIYQAPRKLKFEGTYAIPKKDPDWLTYDQQQEINAEIDPHDRFIIEFMQITGIRPSEARALQKSDIHQDRGYISIRYAIAPASPEEGGGEKIKEVKQKRERKIPYYDELYDLFERMPTNLTPFIFVNKQGHPYSKNINRDVWNPACKRVMGYVVPLNNATRHSFGQQLSNAGTDMETVSKLMGHSNTQVTKDHYADPSLEAAKKAVDNVRGLSNFRKAKNE